MPAVVVAAPVQVEEILNPLPPGTNNIGDVDVLSLPSLPAGSNNIGDVDVLSLPNVTLASQPSPFTTDVNISLAGEQVDVSDRAARDLGKVDIAVFDSALPVGDNLIGRVKISDGTDVADIINSGGANRLQVEALVAAGGATQDVHVIDDNGLNMDVVEDASTPANTRGFLIAGRDQGGITRIPTVTVDPQDDKRRVEITGKVSVSTPDAPPASTPRTVEANSPLGISGTSTINYVIPNGVTFTLLSVTAGSEGDPNERGNKVEVSYVDSASVVHLIERIYISSQTIQIYPNTDRSRDGTIMVGNGTTTQIRIIRYRLGGGTTECDVIVRGFEQ